MNAQQRPGRRTKPGRDTRSRILDAAFQLFHEQGFHATGVSAILGKARVNAGSLYHFFPGKDDLLLGVLEHAKSLLASRVMDPAEARTTDPIGRVFALMDGYRQGMAMAGCKMGCPIGNLALEVADGDSRARKLIRENFERWTLAVKRWLDEAGSRLPADVDRLALARFVLTAMEGGIMQSRAAADLAPFDECVRQMRLYFDLLEERACAQGARRARKVKGRTR
jgi:AcrR family transcriptional regulator